MKRIFNYQKKLLFLMIILTGAVTEMQAQVVIRRPAGVAVVRRPVAPVYRAPARVVVAPRPVVVAPAYRVGVVIGTLPAYYTITYVAGIPYYYSGGIYYVKTEGSESYKVVLPPKGTIVPTLPDGAVKTRIDGISYYEYQGVLYKEVIVDQVVKYEVVGYSNPPEKE